MSALQISDLNDVEKLLVGRFTYRVFAELRRYVELGGVLTVEKVQEFENTLIREVTKKWQEEAAQPKSQAEGPKR